jgi:glycosyltransferase involved in cell wall biosynthesis
MLSIGGRGMKVGVFLEGKHSEEIGGGYTIEREILNSLLKWAENSNHTIVLCSQDPEPPSEIFSVKNVDFVSFHRNLKERFRSKVSRTIVPILQKLQHPRSHFSVRGWYEKFMLSCLVAKGVNFILYLSPFYTPIMDLPYIVILWDLEYRYQPYFPEVSVEGLWDAFEHLHKMCLIRASTIITGTEVGKAQVQLVYQIPKERIKVLPFPTPSFALNAPLKDDLQIRKYNLPENYLFYPAQFWAHKNHFGLLLAVKLLRDKYNLIFPVVFTGSDRGNESYIKKIVTELELCEQVHFLGFVPREDLISLYRKSFALTYLTYFGPDNLPPLEAMALGCPVVASKVSGAVEQYGDAVLLVEPQKTEQIALAIKSLWDDATLRQTLIQRGLTRAHQWTAKDYVKSLFEIMDDFEMIRSCWSSAELYKPL